MKQAVKKLLAVVTVLSVMAAAGSMSVSAAGLRDVFNAHYYADKYDDLKDAFGYDEDQLYQHYLTFGISEGRSASPVFDVLAYREMYGDLDAAFGDNWDAYVEHYFTFGIEEKRISGGIFDPVAYAEAYPDIKAAYGDDWEAIVNHYLTFGIAEGRTAGVTLVTESGQTAQSTETTATTPSGSTTPSSPSASSGSSSSSGSSICEREGHNWSNNDGVCADCGYRCPHELVHESGQCLICGKVVK